MGNIVGSHEPLVTFTARKKQKLLVKNSQLELLIGSILGDAYVSPLGKIQIEHSLKQLDYLNWKYQQLASISYPSLPAHVQRFNRKVQKHYTSVRFWTRQFFRPLRSQFYPNGKKLFPANLELTPLMLAVWYMDDGHYERLKNRAILSTDQFDDQSLERIQLIFQQSFGLATTIRKSKKLAINGLNRENLFSIIQPFIVPSMHYKIH